MAITLVAGLLIGFALTTMGYRHGYLHFHGAHAFVDRLDRELQLTPSQRQQVMDIMRDKRNKMQQLREQMFAQRAQLIAQTHDQIRGVLTPEQQNKFDRNFHPPMMPHGDHDHDRDDHD